MIAPLFHSNTTTGRFYYDFDTGDVKFTEEDLSKIKKEMEKIIKAKLPLIREEVRCVCCLVMSRTSFINHTGAYTRWWCFILCS